MFISFFFVLLVNCSLGQIAAQATVTEIIQRSETVKGLCLKVEDDRFTFKPGQW